MADVRFVYEGEICTGCLMGEEDGREVESMDERGGEVVWRAGD